MSTDVIHVSTERVVAHRFFGGPERGTVVQMECTREEWPQWANEMVREEGWQRECTFAHWMSIQERVATVEWDSAARQNRMARQFEDHRWSDSPSFARAAAQCRDRARFIARSTMRVIA